MPNTIRTGGGAASLAVLFFHAFITPAFAGGGLVFNEALHDFGALKTPEKVEYPFTFTNKGESVITITGITPSCGCTAAVEDKKRFKPGETGAIRVIFNPAGKRGLSTSSVKVFTDGAGGPHLLRIRANVIPAAIRPIKVILPPPKIIVRPQEVNVGRIRMGKVAVYRLVIANRGDGDLYITNIGAQNKNGLPLNKKPIRPGKKVEITAMYKPEKKGPFKEFLIIKSNDPETPETNVKIYGTAE
jgi:hypothetical protein